MKTSIKTKQIICVLDEEEEAAVNEQVFHGYIILTMIMTKIFTIDI